METIWLQRSTADIPWGFRLQGGRDYGVPLSVQRVTAGSVAAAGLCQGDQILKIGTISANDLSHMEGQELIKRAGNILQLTIKSCPVPVSPTGPYGSQVTAQLYDSGAPISPQQQQQQQNHHHHQPYPATHTSLPDGSTRIQIQRSQPVSAGPPLPPTPKVYEEDNAPFGFGGGEPSSRGMPDYTIPYRHADPYQDGSAGSPYGGDDDGYRSQNAYNVTGGSMSLPRGVGYGGDRGGRQGEPRTLPISLTNQPASSSQPQSAKFNPTQAYESRIGSSRHPDPLDEITSSAYPVSPTSAFSPAGASQPLMSPTGGQQRGAQPVYSKIQVSTPYSEPSRPTVNSYASGPYSPQVQQQPQQPSYGSRAQQSPMSPTASYSNQSTLQRGYSQEQQPAGYGQEQPAGYGQEQQPAGYGQEQPAGYGQEQPQRGGDGYYDSQYYDRPASPQQSYPARTPYQPQQQYNSYSPYGGEPQPDPYNAPRPEAPPSYSQTFPRRQTSYERQPSYDRSQPSDGYVSNTVFNQQAGVSDFGYDESAAGRSGPQPYRPPEPAGYKPSVPQPYRPSEPQPYRPPESQPYRPEEPQHYRPPEPVRSAPQDNAYDAMGGYRRQDSHPLSPGVRSVQPDFSKPSYSPQTAREYDGRGGDYGAAPPPPPPPAPSALASGASWIPPARQSSQARVGEVDDEFARLGLALSDHPPPVPPAPVAPPPPPPANFDWGSVSRPVGQSVDGDGQKIPDELLSSVLKSKGGGPKPFSYGVDLNELKKKIGPPTAPKSFRKKQSSPAGGQEDPDTSVMYSNKPAAGHIQGDYRRRPDEGPRAQIDTSPINISMGTNPKKQSMSFKVLQWMTDTENTPDEPGQPGIAHVKNEPPPRTRRAPRDPTVHNAEDDEMRFSGLHPKTEIPSRSFKTLQKIPNESGAQNHAATGQQGEEYDDGLPDTLDPEEMSDRRYKGGHIPSKVFKHLQKVVGDDTPETPPNEQQNGDAPAPRPAKAPTQDVTATDF